MRIARKGTLRFLDGYDLLLTVVAAGRTDPVGWLGLVAMAALATVGERTFQFARRLLVRELECRRLGTGILPSPL